MSDAPPPTSPLRRLLGRFIWAVAAVAIALGGAGIAAGADHAPGDAGRPELTWRADARFGAAVAALDAPLGDLSADVCSLSQVVRSVLADLVARKEDAVAADLEKGSALAAKVAGHVAKLGSMVRALPYVNDPGVLGTASLDRLDAALTALRAVEPIASGWGTLAAGVGPAADLGNILVAHDEATFAATQHGVKGEYAAALADLQTAGTQLDLAKKARDSMASVADVSTLSSWIEIARTHDDALVALYTEMKASKGRVTDKAKAALDAVQKAEARLPKNDAALVVILGDVANGGLNQAAISIEKARGDLAAAISALH